MYTIERVRKEFFAIVKAQGITEETPVEINGRLTRTLGRVMGAYDAAGNYLATRVEFSRQLLETATDECIYSVIQHEAAHYIVDFETHEHHGHDATFKAVCARIGCDNSQTRTHVERTVAESSIFKYQVYCDTCDRVISNYSRMSRTLKNLSECYCKTCRQYNLRLIQNW